MTSAAQAIRALVSGSADRSFILDPFAPRSPAARAEPVRPSNWF